MSSDTGPAGRAVAEAARVCIGARVRAQGRTPEFGFDCLGLVLHCLAEAGLRVPVPADYDLRADNVGRLIGGLSKSGLRRIAGPARGCIFLSEVAPRQAHMGVVTGRRIVHADFALRRVVEQQMPGHWRVISLWSPDH